ncbi:PilZ domain-containing protein [Halioxenophilus sp. WMMB6]|uniref:PilZ domain-containing protein n=1 Tax=Halioxenophilus sp. WMMB6 TaxID=3073815 RepID=UPI00295E64F8|nr:PilZ domain-containing protein [Halioxenophilus sp. WMMB6]
MNEQRKEIRLDYKHTIIIELEAEQPDDGEEVIAICHSVDVSSSGLQLTLNQPVEPNRMLFISIILEQNSAEQLADGGNSPERFNLVAEVVWQRAIPDSTEFRTGLTLLHSEETHFADWQAWVQRQL